MGENQNNSDEDRFEESLRQILDSAPSKGRLTAGELPRPKARPDGEQPRPAYMAEEAETEPKALFWFKLMRPLAVLALLALLAMFVLRVTER